LLCAVGLQCFWKHTYWGKYCLAIGEDRGYNRNDVEKTGINVVLVTAVTYGLAAVFFAVGTYTLLLSAGYGSSSRNAEYLYQGIAAAGLAGSMYRQHKNGASGLVIATATMMVLRQAFMALKIDKCLIIVEGLVILLTILNKDKKN
jgi:ribose/xylose/arabinose/galactoside ABC-type transport system permease subunit